MRFTRSARICGILLTGMFLLVSCNKRLNEAVEPLPEVFLPKFGAENTLEIATWNIERFPLAGDLTIDKVAEIMLNLDVDLYAVQEINNENALVVLMDSLNSGDSLAHYAYRLTPFSSDIRTGIIYKSSIISVRSEAVLFSANSADIFDFAGRPPYALNLVAEKNGRQFDFTVIVLHLKAFGDQESEDRRRRSVQKLEDYVTAQLENPGSDPDFVILGDWNDELDDPENDNIFLPFLQDTTRYLFLTEPFAGDPDEFTFVDGFQSLIDHILITRSVDAAYPDRTTQILKLDSEVPQYIPQVSDHRPVATRLPAF